MDRLNKAALAQFARQPVNPDMISYLARVADSVVAHEDAELPTLNEFITQLVAVSNTRALTLMSTLVYFARLKSKLSPEAHGLPSTPHRIFLASLILATKYLHDCPPKNKHWVSENLLIDFSKDEVNSMEKQLICILEWNLSITEYDLYAELEPFLEPLRARITESQMTQRGTERRTKATRPASSQAYWGHSKSAQPLFKRLLAYPESCTRLLSSRRQNAAPWRRGGNHNDGSRHALSSHYRKKSCTTHMHPNYDMATGSE